MAVVVITQPTEPVPSLDEVKLHLKVDSTYADGDILSKIWGAITEFDDPNLGVLGRAIMRREIEVSFDVFCGSLPLPLFPVMTGDDFPMTVKYDDADGNEQAASASLYRVLDGQSSDCRISLKSGSAWPSAIDQEQAVRVRYWVGYADDDPRIANFKTAVKFHVEMTFDTDTEGTQNLRQSIDRLLSPYRVITI